MTPKGYKNSQLLEDDLNKELIKEMNKDCIEEEIEESYVLLEHQPYVYGCIHEEKLVAIGSAFEFGGHIDIGIITHPEHRGKGLGSSIIAKIATEIQKDKKIPLWKTAAILKGLCWKSKA